ncbi:MAG: hypothetical protein ACYC1B_09155 [Thermoleophilia bacterium]
MLQDRIGSKYIIDRTDWQTAVDFAVRSNRWVIACLTLRQWGDHAEASIANDISADEGILHLRGAAVYLLPFLIMLPLFIYLDQVLIYSYLMIMVFALFFLVRFLVSFRRMALKHEIADFLKEGDPA